MLNRRLLRAKVMQALYGYFQSRASSYFVAEEHIKSYFEPDLNALVPPDHEAARRNTEAALAAFRQAYQSKLIGHSSHIISQEVQQAVQQAIYTYQQHVEQDKRHFRQLLLSEVEGLYTRYLSVLSLLIELAHMAALDRDRKPLNPQTVKVLAHYKLADNQYISFLRTHHSLNEAFKRYYISWAREEEVIKTLYWELLRKDPVYQAYQSLPQAKPSDDYHILDHIIRQHIFAKPISEQEQSGSTALAAVEPYMYTYFEERDLNWQENRTIVRSMVLKTIKSIDLGQPDQFRLLDLSLNWEDDKAFILTLYNHTIEEEEQNLHYIRRHLKAWDIKRLVMVDKILLQMAIAEMIYCPQIPVKVTINEFVELAKHYSSPKSRIFVNGLLDAIAQQLQAEGRILKSGRGLIDGQ